MGGEEKEERDPITTGEREKGERRNPVFLLNKYIVF